MDITLARVSPGAVATRAAEIPEVEAQEGGLRDVNDREDEAEAELTRRKRDDTELNEAIEARLKKVVPSVPPIVKSLGKVNFAITTWLKGGGRQVRILRNGDARLKVEEIFTKRF